MPRSSLVPLTLLIVATGTGARAQDRQEPAPFAPGDEAPLDAVLAREVKALEKLAESPNGSGRFRPGPKLLLLLDSEPVRARPARPWRDAMDIADEDEEPPTPRRFRVPVLAPQNFDGWVFGNMQTAEARRDWLDFRLKEAVEAARAEHRLSIEQAEKLRLAGRGDIKRFLVAVESKRREYDALRTDPQRGTDLLYSLRPLESAFGAGPFGEGSLFAKTLARELAPGS